MVRPRSRRKRGTSSISIKIARWKRRVLIIASISALLLLALTIWSLRLKSRSAPPGPEVKDKQEKAELEKLAQSGDSAKIVVKRALEADDQAGFLHELRPSERKLETWQEWQKILQKDGPVSRFEWMSPLTVGSVQAEQFLVTFQSGRNRILAALKDGDSWLLDWDGFARTTVPPWPELMKAENPSAILRIYAARDEYYQGEFRDDQVWMCVALASPDWDELLFGYVKRDTPSAKRMEALLEQKSPQRFTVRVRGPIGGPLKQFEILELLSDSWVEPEPAGK